MNRWIEKTVILLSWGCGTVLVGSLLSLILYLLYHGIGSLGRELIFGDVAPLQALLLREHVFDGLFPAICGTLMLVVLSVAIAIPVGISAGIYISEYAGERFRRIAGIFTDILSGVPSIVVGLAGFSLALFLHNHFSGRIYPCLIFSALSLACLVLPYIIRTTEVSLSNISDDLRKTALALGATRLQLVMRVLIPNALGGIASGIILAIGRCAEDTAVIMMTGVVASSGLPGSVFDHYEALPFYIFYISSEYGSRAELATGFGAALILLVICAALFLTSMVIKRQVKNRLLYRI